jgi:methyl-accepting chemotaxis protein
VQDSVTGIRELSEKVADAEKVIVELGASSQEVATILTVIDEVADQTSLLALNATIIAAQAGERGKGFAVVADEIRDLAERTAASTKEISRIIHKLKADSEEAVEVMKVGRQRADEEVERSLKAEAALEKIRESTEDSREQVQAIEKFTHEQTTGSRNITDSVGKVTGMLSQIASAVKQLSTGITQTAEFSESLKSLAGRVKSSTEEQAAGSKHINENMETVRSMIDRIDETTRDQSDNTEKVVGAVSGVNEVAEMTAEQSTELEAIVRQLAEHASTLQQEVGVFRIDDETRNRHENHNANDNSENAPQPLRRVV